jgi:HEAT repeat protein
MRLHQIRLMVAAILFGNVALSAAEKPGVDELVRELAGDKPAQARTPEQLKAACAQVLDSLMPDLGSQDPGRRASAQGTIEKIAFYASRPGAEAERAACSKAIAGRLGPEAGPLARVWLLRQVERIGRAEAVPQITRLLADKDPLVRESARRALQKNSSKEANAALGHALGSADTPAWRMALINALAERRDAANLSLLLKEAASDNDDIRCAAVIGLAKLGDLSAAKTIAAAMTRGSPRARMIATDSYFRLAEALAAKGDKRAALRIYRQMLGGEGQVKCAAILGLGRIGSENDLTDITGELQRHPDARVRDACVEALSLLQGEEVTRTLVAMFWMVAPPMKPALLQALAGRGDRGELRLAVFKAAAEQADEDVRVVALAGLRKLGDATVVPLLLKAVVAGGKTQETARQTLQVLRGADVDKALLGLFEQQDAKTRVELIRALAARHVVAATPLLLKAAGDADPGVRSESLRALGEVAPSSALAAVAAVLLKTDDAGSRNEAANTLVNIANRDRDIDNRSGPILQAIQASSGPAKFALLGVLGRIGGRNSLVYMRAAVKDPDEKIRDAAIHALAEWPDATAADDLLALAKSAASETHQVLALRGYIRVCSIQSDRPPAETARMLIVGLETAKRPDEKRQALGGLAQVPHISALKAVVPCLGNEAIKEEAAVATVYIGHYICNDHPEAVKEAVEKAVAITKNEGIKQFANDILGRVEQKLKETRPKR